MKRKDATKKKRGSGATGAARSAHISFPAWAHRLAPTLCEDLERKVMGENCTPCRTSECTRCERDIRELRALLAVARAAQFDKCERDDLFPDLLNVPGSGAYRLDRALARLSRASGGER